LIEEVKRGSGGKEIEDEEDEAGRGSDGLEGGCCADVPVEEAGLDGGVVEVAGFGEDDVSGGVVVVAGGGA
jgi:hypothetical protein